MILTVTLNAALDVTYETSSVEWGGSNRVGTVVQRAGGKGVNVARVAAALGSPVLATGLLGGATGDLVRADLDRSGLRHDFAPVAGASRRTLTVVETSTGAATVLNEPGPHVTPDEWQAFLGHFRSLAGSAGVVTLSGSLPPGLAPDAYATLTACVPSGVPVILDADGNALARGVGGAPALVKPNAEELTRATGIPSAVHGAEALRTAGARAVLVSMGPDGMIAVTPDGSWRAVPPSPVAGNPTGAGDAAVAAAARSLASGTPWPDLLRHAVALSAAAVRAPVAGDFDPALYTRLLPEIAVHRLT
ncbi:1-phosphofructokinase family hexose kinase [Spirillospora sp. NPDC047279]|uniref:1-phosphofructokinase family hexose kinase n=1 Tax=Spirillospora sp. NPDC047279 TaxID=3155478 RepID=UPI0033F2D275